MWLFPGGKSVVKAANCENHEHDASMVVVMVLLCTVDGLNYPKQQQCKARRLHLK